VVAEQKTTGLVAMVGHTRRFNPSHQFVRRRILEGEFHIQQMDVQTFFFRRTNMNALGQPRSWTDHLLWHHAAHTIDLFQYQAGQTISDCYAVQGPIHPQLGIAMDMGIVAKVPSGSILTLSLSFNNDGPLGSFFRYICDNGTYKAYYDDLVDGKDNKIDLSKVDVSMDGIELEDACVFAFFVFTNLGGGLHQNACVLVRLWGGHSIEKLSMAHRRTGNRDQGTGIREWATGLNHWRGSSWQ